MNFNPALPDIPDRDYLMHYGVGKLDGAPGPGSGRYPLGSGENGNQRMDSFRNVYEELKKQGMDQKQIADAMGMSTTKLRQMISVTKEQELANNIATAQELKARGYGATEIGRRMGGVSEATVRGWLAAGEREKRSSAKETTEMLKQQILEKGCLDVGSGVEKYIGVSKTMLNTAVADLKEQGYGVYEVMIPQLGMPGKYTTVKVLADPSMEKSDITKDYTKIKSIEAFSNDCGESFHLTEYPESISSSRLKVRYAEEGGIQKDGVMELRPGCADLDLQGSHYAQVRIAVDGTHYLKGLAVYGDPKDFPDGVDIIFNTNKHVGTPLMMEDKNADQVLKKIKNDADLPFGAVIKADGGQYHYTDENGVDHLGCINKVNDEGDWGKWSKSLSSQFLSKQSMQLIKQQLDLSYADKVEYFDSIMKMDNPAVRQNLLESFASKMDSSAVDLKAAAMPGQQSHVIIPVPSLKDNEIYAPNYKNGEDVVLIRYPHGGIFEIPECRVNNKNEEAKRVIGTNSKDAVGINAKVAEQLSGADFDGDTVLVIPNREGKVKTAPALEGLKDFDPKQYKVDHPTITGSRKQQEMGKVSNLITDMTLKGATMDEICRAVKHSMVVIDSEKHHLDWQQSEKDQNIKELKAKYQGGENRGASTLISRASSEARINEREVIKVTDEGKVTKGYSPNKDTGEWEFRDTGRTYDQPLWNRDGTPKLNPDGSQMTKQVKAQIKTTKMAAVRDAHTLSSGTKQEEAYADYANALKALANKARKEAMAIKPIPADPNAKKVYAAEVASLNAKLNDALKNSPKERQAQILANIMVRAKKASNPEIMDNKDQLKKVKQQSLATARARVGANKKAVEINITPKEWEAIQNKAISTTKLKEILKNTNMDKVREYASPKTVTISSSKINIMKAMARSGYTNAEIAERVGVSTSTVQKYT